MKTAAPFFLPVVAIYLLKLTAGPNATFAGQQTPEDPVQITPAVTVQPLPEESLTTARWSAKMREESFGESPLYYATAVVDDMPEVIDDGPGPTPPDMPPPIRLEGVMESGQQAIALINGKVLKIGDTISGKWAIESIDVTTRTVTIKHADGRELMLEPEN